MAENETENRSASEIVKDRIDGLDTSIAKRLGQIKKTTARATKEEKEKIASYLKTVQLWIDEILELCYAKPVESEFSLGGIDTEGQPEE